MTVLLTLFAAMSILGLAGLASVHGLPVLYVFCAWPALAVWFYVRGPKR